MELLGNIVAAVFAVMLGGMSGYALAVYNKDRNLKPKELSIEKMEEIERKLLNGDLRGW